MIHSLKPNIMGKKFTTLLIAMATMLLSIPTQAQETKLARKATTSVSKRGVEMRQIVKKATVGKKEAVLRAADAKVEGKAFQAFQGRPAAKSRSVASGEKLPFSQQFLLGNMTQTALPFHNTHADWNMMQTGMQGRRLAPRKAATTDANGIITAPDEGEHKFYNRSGSSYYASGQSVYGTDQSGLVEIVEASDGTVYIHDIVSTFSQDTWVKGTKNGNTITVAAAQPVGFNSNYNATLSVFWGDVNGSNVIKDATSDITFTISGNTISLDGSNENHFITVFWDDDDSWSGYGDYNTVWTLNEDYEAPTTDLVELPAGATVEDWFAVGDAGEDAIPSNVQVAFVGSNVYIGGLFADFPSSWIKGTLSGSTVTFSGLQYQGQYSTYDIWAAGIDANDNFADFTMTYDQEGQKLTLDEGSSIAANASYLKLYYLNLITSLTLSKEEPTIEFGEAVTPPYTADFSTEAPMSDFTVIDNNGDKKTWTWSSTYGAFYNYDSSNPADDYLVLPVNLSAGKVYTVTVTASARSTSFPERFEVVAGQGNKAADLTQQVIASTDVTTTEDTDYEGALTVDADGEYLVAIHAISDANMWSLNVKKFSIEEASNGGAPAVSTAFSAVAGPDGALYVDLTATAPTTAIDGTELSGSLIAKFYRDNEEISMTDAIEPGAEVTYRDEAVENGKDYTYYVVFTNSVGDGQKSEKQTVRVGADDLADITGLQVTEDTGNSLTFGWDPAEGLNGGYVDPSTIIYSLYTLVEYDIYPPYGFYVMEPDQLMGTVTGETTLNISYNTDEGDPRYEYFGVSAKNSEEGEETDATTEYVTVLAGAPYELPIEEGFAGGSMHYAFLGNDNFYYQFSEDASDEDGSAMALGPYSYDGEVTFETFKLNLASAANPTLLFDLKNMQGAVESVDVFAIKSDGSEVSLQTGIPVTDEYVTTKVSLLSLKDDPRFVRIGIRAIMDEAYDAETEVDNSDFILIDNFRIIDLYEYDMSIALNAPASVKAGESATITAKVKNEGESVVNGYTVTIKADGETLFEQTVNESLEAFKSSEYTAVLETSKFDDAADVIIEATVVYENDLNPENDEASTILSVKQSTAAQPEDVAAEQNEEGITITWSAPSTGSFSEYTETFEEGEGGWTFIDSDGDGFNWNRFDNTGLTSGRYSTHEGECVVFSESYSNDSQSPLTPDNWLVSPKASLNGTFKFWAAGLDPDYADEHFAVYVSTTSPTDVSTFEQVSEEFIATSEYAEYTVDLSSYAGQEGWIAIRHFNVTDMFVLLVDDITFMAVGGDVESYNIYIDGELVGNTTDVTYDYTSELSEGDHEVAVSAVYSNGDESKPVIATVTVVSGIEQISVDGKPVDIYSLDGKLVRHQATDLNGLKGIYVVGDKKVIIK